MFCINLSRTINAPRKAVWDVITNTECYAEWNKFVVACDTTFEPATPIRMKVKLLPFTINQKETIWNCREEELIDYRTKQPLKMLSSIRQHKLEVINESMTRYHSLFELKGWLSPIVKLFLGKQLRRGFTDMTDGVVQRSEELPGI